MLSNSNVPVTDQDRMYNNFSRQSVEERNPFTITRKEVLPGTKFYRVVRVFGVFDKRGANADSECPMNAGIYTCPAMELRYCVKVIWTNRTPGDVELCGILTNFKS